MKPDRAPTQNLAPNLEKWRMEYANLQNVVSDLAKKIRLKALQQDLHTSEIEEQVDACIEGCEKAAVAYAADPNRILESIHKVQQIYQRMLELAKKLEIYTVN